MSGLINYIFSYFDDFVLATELRRVIIGLKFSDEQADEMFREVDINEDGRVNCDDFVTKMSLY
jgi:Ca2+-binding EF-hand superfamily protein